MLQYFITNFDKYSNRDRGESILPLLGNPITPTLKHEILCVSWYSYRQKWNRKISLSQSPFAFRSVSTWRNLSLWLYFIDNKYVPIRDCIRFFMVPSEWKPYLWSLSSIRQRDNFFRMLNRDYFPFESIEFRLMLAIYIRLEKSIQGQRWLGCYAFKSLN